MEFRILGPAEVYGDNGQLLGLVKPRHLATLCVLLLNRGSLLTRSHLIEAIWGPDSPGDPGGALRSYIYNLRKIDGIGDRLRTHPSGYTIQLLDSDVYDVSLFLSLTQEGLEASRNADHATAAERLERAIGIWRTPALADLPATPTMHPLARVAAGFPPLPSRRPAGRPRPSEVRSQADPVTEPLDV